MMRSMGGFALGIALLLMIALVGQALTATVNEFNSSISAYLLGESYWSKARSSATQLLYRYAVERDAALLDEADQMLDVQLGDRDARFALDHEPPDLDAARAGFERGMNPSGNIDRLVWVYRWLRDLPALRDAMDSWRATDPMLSRVVALKDELRTAVQSSDEETISRLIDELLQTDARMGVLQKEFLDDFVKATDWVHRALVVFSAIGFSMLTLVSALLLRLIVRRVRASEGSFRAAFEQAAIGMIRVGDGGRLLAANDRICARLGYSEAELQRMGFDRIDGSDGDSGLRALREKLFASSEGSISEERDFIARNGRPLRIKLTASMVRNHEPGSSRMLALLEDVSEAHRLSEELHHHVTHDALSGLANRRELQRSLAQLLARSRRDDSRHALLLLDIDRFKLVNDSAGPAAGDEYLRRVASRLSDEIGAKAVLARVGSDEFAVALESVTIADALALAERMEAIVSGTTFRWGAFNSALTACIGIVEISPDAPDTNWVLRAADIACYLAKEEGPGRIRVYVESDEAVSRRRSEVEWVSEVRLALDEDRVFLFAQPIHDFRDGSRLRYEVLARLFDRSGRMHTPGAFIPAIERYGRIDLLDREIVRKTLAMLAEHPQHVARLESCHINISAQSLATPSFRDYVVCAIKGSNMPGAKFCFELTETAAISNLAEARAFIDAVHALGCKVALDDFGSGMSSFGYLKTLAVDILKVDGVFARGAADDSFDRTVLQAIGRMGHALGKYTIAESVESDAAMQAIQALGIDAAQGYAIGKPQPLEALITADAGVHGDAAVH